MGDPHSPGMAIGTCAWMEQQWLKSLSASQKSNFTAKRYMDDVILFYTDKFDAASSISQCYRHPLKLEDAKDDTFLESTFTVNDGNKIVHWLKNENEAGKPQKVWRYAHFHSHMAHNQKKAVLKACLQKLYKMASNNAVLHTSAVQKLQEFGRLKYPYKLLWTLCTTMGVETRNTVWFDVRDTMR